MRLRVSRLCVFTWRDGQLICDDPARHRQFALSLGAQGVLRRFADWTDFADGPDAGLVRQLVEAHILVAEGSPEHRFEENLGPWTEWGTAATYFHLATRNHRDEKFATAAEDTAWLLEHIPDRPQPSEKKEYPGAGRVELPYGDDSPLSATSLERALRARRTTRRLHEGSPVTGDQLATLLRWVAGPLHRVPIPKLRPAMLKAYPYPWQAPADVASLASSAPPRASIRPPHVCALVRQIDEVSACGDRYVTWHVLKQRDEPA